MLCKVYRRDDADYPVCPVNDRKGFDIVLPQQRPGFVKMGTELNGDHIPGHDVCTAEFSESALKRMQLCLMKQALQVIPADVQDLVILFQYAGKVIFIKPETLFRQRVRGPWLGLMSTAECG